MKRQFHFSLTLTAVVTASVVTFFVLSLIKLNEALAHGTHEHDAPVQATTLTTSKMLELVNQSTLPAFNEQALTGVTATLSSRVQHSTASLAERLLYARLLQHQHHFGDALEQLTLILNAQPDSAEALLLMANVQLNQGMPAAAQQTCMALLGKTSSLILSTCLLEAKMQQAPSADYYAQLKEIAGKFPPDSDEVALWSNEVLAEMALYNEHPQAAIKHIEQQPDAAWPVSSWVTWSKAKLAVNRAQDILNRLTPHIASNPVPNDSMLLYLALAAQQTGQAQHWITQMAQRVFIRQQRNDTTHAAEMALYYLHLSAEPDMALHWATINWQQAKSLNDKTLLARVQALTVDG